MMAARTAAAACSLERYCSLGFSPIPAGSASSCTRACSYLAGRNPVAKKSNDATAATPLCDKAGPSTSSMVDSGKVVGVATSAPGTG
jgi:hypothetical protein